MKALVCSRLGGPEDLGVEDLPDPVAGPGEALVRVRVAALNFFDTLIIAGRYQVKPELPFSPGGEACGVIEALGAGAESFSVGDRVMVHLSHGTARERIAVPVKRLARVPEAVSDEIAAGLSITYGTTLHALRDRARIRPGETLVVLGASGGVGLAAVELGKLLGARVIACASSPEKLETARAHGADDLIDYKADNLREALRRLTGERGVDVVYDAVGGDLAEPAMRALGWKGRFLVIGFAAGEIPKFPLNVIMLKGIDVQGVHWGAFVEREPEAHAANQAQLLAWAAEGKLTVKVHGVYPLDGYAEALGVLVRREAVGKVLLDLGG
ncbi:NADPH:quinone oxidoreductase family protein [Methylorubrum extorquens]|uniref:NADPH:quinone oxidoreductase family protein n=1 Tax=Methylorubrum extorquens TaxID=408 RepID=UPI0001590655|nr:NADPH:quinone oxidoreductase family protein [Methylorubrum extorquens]ABY29366.1 Alcohol dehydrogenase zinc-binding domain protein [Methylorubrum extorquens PA1]KQP89435.1 NADPH:quinone oxidoreductase [Methylobacterium sp. Leaf119]WIU40706.1 NADPH:quinone oxidoreductase family protein [Methylorubrum extorquens]